MLYRISDLTYRSDSTGKTRGCRSTTRSRSLWTASSWRRSGSQTRISQTATSHRDRPSWYPTFCCASILMVLFYTVPGWIHSYWFKTLNLTDWLKLFSTVCSIGWNIYSFMIGWNYVLRFVQLVEKYTRFWLAKNNISIFLNWLKLILIFDSLKLMSY